VASPPDRPSGVWDRLEGRVGELSSWVGSADCEQPDGKDDISIEKLEEQLNSLKETFQEKEGMVEDISLSCGAKGLYPTGGPGDMSRRSTQGSLVSRKTTPVPPEQLPQTVDVEATIAVPAPAQPVEEPKPEAAAPEAIQEAAEFIAVA